MPLQMSKLLDYINLLDTNATAREAHNVAPAASMAQFGLDTIEQQTLMSGDSLAIASLAGISPSVLPKIQISNDTYTKPV